MMSPGVRRIIFGGSSLHPATRAFRALTGATDLRVVDKIVRYADGQGLLSQIRLFPFKSAQNKGSGTTLYGIGGWTGNDVSLIDGPVWQADGVAFDGTNDRGTWDATGIAALNDLYFFDVQKPSLGSLADTPRFGVLSIGDGRGALPHLSSNGISGIAGMSSETCCIGRIGTDSIPARAGGNDLTWTAGEKTQLVSRLSSTGQMWKSKAQSNMSIKSTGGVQNYAPSSTGLSSTIVYINSIYNGETDSHFVFYQTTRVALLACKTSLTTAQRETLTDLLDEL